MNRYFLSVLLCAGILISSCTQTPEKTETSVIEGDFSGTLTQEEIAGGVLTAEILWKFGRLGSMNLSPDGKEVLYTVARYDVGTNKSISDIFKISTGGGEPSRLTDGAGKYYSPTWFPTGDKIGFLTGGQLWEMGPDGNGKKQVSFLGADINHFDWSPDGSSILLTMDVKLEETPREVYPDLPETNVRIIDDLMYRHWNAWHDYAYSHIFVATYDETGPGEPLDIMEGELWDAPLAPYHDDAEITWSPDGKQIAYTCKRMKGREYAMSTNSDVYLYDLASGETKNMTPGMPGYDKYPSFSEDGSKLAFQSMATPGYEADQVRLFVIDLASGQMEYWTEGFDQNVDHVIWKGDKLYFISGIHATFQLYEMDAESKDIRQITKGHHTYGSFALAGDVMVAT
ncbi:MAG: PD40 domain-containing protein, partial [Bacteroidales bacterium]|nr:PD40 domain-containing protein [Bacteroidales bacterium]